ncbi:hypothetical protein WIV_gp126 [Wiseana iridescent virus]|uniref:Uncharacterized protein n=1 Tax=Wiseana iridescent virus TaxID=68347 RepID=G0T5F2_IRV9|nr:hypothetical protein WIV_gp126 [Wiseana iridescent virus]ADO00470.1 hypothetical protein [Wiseana iridescent virus]
MEPNNYNGVHIISEAVIMGGISMYFYKKISELESTVENLQSTVENLKGQIIMQNNQIRFLLGSNQPQLQQFNGLNHNASQQTTPLKMPQFKPQKVNQPLFREEVSREEINEKVCEGGVCKLVPKTHDKKVVISKVSKQVDFDKEGITPDETFKVNTFTNFSPNPVLKSVTPKPSTSVSENTGEDELQKILNDIDDE